MLAIKRKSGQLTYITCPDGTIITIHTETLRGGYVRLGIEAPREYQIDREERLPEHLKPKGKK